MFPLVGVEVVGGGGVRDAGWVVVVGAHSELFFSFIDGLTGEGFKSVIGRNM